MFSSGAIRIKSKGDRKSSASPSNRFRPTVATELEKVQNTETDIENTDINPTPRQLSGNFVEKTKLSLLSRTLYKDEAERKSQNLPDVFKPQPGDNKPRPSTPAPQSITTENEYSRSPLFAPKASRPRLKGLPFGFKPASPKASEPKNSFDISRFSKKGSKFLPPKLRTTTILNDEKELVKKEEEIVTSATKDDVEIIEEALTPTIQTTFTPSEDSNHEDTVSTTSSISISSSSVTPVSSSISSTRPTEPVRRRKPVPTSSTTTTTAATVDDAVIETFSDKLITSEEEATARQVLLIDEGVTEESEESDTMTAAIPTTTTVATTEKETEENEITENVPKKVRGRLRSRGRLGIGERRKNPNHENTVSNSAARIEDTKQLSSSRGRSRIRGRGRSKPRPLQEIQEHSSASEQQKSSDNPSPVKLRGRDPTFNKVNEVNVERDNDEKSFEETSKLRFRGRVRGNHRFVPRTSEKMKIGSEDVEEEDRSLSLTTGSRRQLKIHSQEENEIDTEDIKSFKLSHSQNRGSKVQKVTKSARRRFRDPARVRSSSEVTENEPNDTTESSKTESTTLKEVKMIKEFGRKSLSSTTISNEVSDGSKDVTTVKSRHSVRVRGKIQKKKMPTKEAFKKETADENEHSKDSGSGRRNFVSRQRFRNRPSQSAKFENKRTNVKNKVQASASRSNVRQRSRGRGRGRSRPEVEVSTTTTTQSTTTKISVTTSTTTIFPSSTSTLKEYPVTITEADYQKYKEELISATVPVAETIVPEDDTEVAGTEYHFFPAESEQSKEKYRLQQENIDTIDNPETQLETDDIDSDLSEHLNSALNLATVTWTQVS